MGVDVYDYYERRSRRRSKGIGRYLGHLIFFLASLIPMSILAWRMDLHGLFGERVQVKPAVAPEQNEPVRVPARVVRVQQPAVVSPQSVQAEPQPVDETLPPSPPLEASPTEPPPDPAHVVSLDLEQRRQAEPVPFESPRLVRLSGLSEDYVIDPADGSLPATVTVRSIVAGDVQLHVSARGREIKVDATVATKNGQEVALTLDRMQRLQRRLAEASQQAAAQFAAATREKNEINAWLNAPVGKLYTTREQARARLLVLNRAAPALEERAGALHAEHAAVQSLVELAKRLNGKCKLYFQSANDDPGDTATETDPGHSAVP